MKKTRTIIVTGIMLLSMGLFYPGMAQEEATEEETSPFSTGLDVYSSYIWRGAKFGNGAAFQPYVEYSVGGFAIGGWGSVSTGGIGATDSVPSVLSAEGFEMDLYASYSFDFGLSIAVTDYYFGGAYFDGGMHFIEPSLSYEIKGFSLMGAYMIGDGVEDTYVEAGYSFGDASIFVGAGDGQYTSDGEFMVCNVGIGTSKEIKVTENFSLPVSGAIVLNPSTEGFFITAGVSF